MNVVSPNWNNQVKKKDVHHHHLPRILYCDERIRTFEQHCGVKSVLNDVESMASQAARALLFHGARTGRSCVYNSAVRCDGSLRSFPSADLRASLYFIPLSFLVTLFLLSLSGLLRFLPLYLDRIKENLKKKQVYLVLTWPRLVALHSDRRFSAFLSSHSNRLFFSFLFCFFFSIWFRPPFC